MPQRDTLFDTVRAICALEIIGYWHMFEYIGIRNHEFGEIITIGVLATFTFTSSYFLGQRQIINVKEFYIRRLKRFYIPFFVSLSILFAANIIYSPKVYILSIVGLSGLFPPMPITLWYLDMLILFYLLTPWLQNSNNEKRYYLCHIGCFILLLILTFFFGADNRMAIYFPFYSLGLIGGPKLVRSIIRRRNWLFIISSTILGLFLIYRKYFDHSI